MFLVVAKIYASKIAEAEKNGSGIPAYHPVARGV